MLSQLTGPSPRRAAKPLLMSTFTCTALAAITAGPIKIKIVRTPESRHWKSGLNLKPTRRSDGNWAVNCQRPPMSVPIDNPIRERAPKCGSNHQPSATPAMMEPRLKKLEAIAGGPKTFRAFNIPMASAASDTSKMKGHMMRVSKMVSSVFSGDQLHQVSNPTSCGAKAMPRRVTALMKIVVRVATLFARRHAESSPSVAIFCENVVMKAVERAPSAKRSRNMLGKRNAIRNASRFRPAPKSPAKTCSRINPSTRLQSTASPTTLVALVLTRLSSLAGMAKKEQRPALCERGKCEPVRQALLLW